MRARSLFTRSLVEHLVALMLLTLLVAGAFFFSVRRSVDVWNVNRGQRLENLILPNLSDVYRGAGSLDAARIHEQLRPILTANVYAYVFDPSGVPVYIYSLGREVPLYDEPAVQVELERLRRSDSSPVPVFDGPDLIGYLAADTVGFTHDAVNRRFLASITSTLLAGMGGAVLVALGAAWLFATKLSRETRAVAGGLREIAAGRRNVSFLPTTTRELREISDSARRMQVQLIDEERMRRQWMEDISHDLRTPVAALKSQLEGIIDGYLPANRDRLINLHDEVAHVEWLVSDLRELSTIESPDTVIIREPVALGEFVGRIAEGVRVSMEESRATLRICCSLDEPVPGDPHLLRRAFGNLIRNAFEHVEPGGEVVISIEKRDEQAIVDIANTGLVKTDEIARFFDRLYRGNKRRGSDGSGLGLPIARTIFARHDGYLAMQQRGTMTHLFVQLPLRSPRR